MLRARPRPRFGPLSILALALLVLWAGLAAAALDPARRAERMRPLLAAPAAHERLQESDVVFVFERPRGASELRLLLSPRAFDASGWTAIPDLPGLIVRDAPRGVLTLAQAGVSPARESPWWWTVAARDGATGAWSFAGVRSFTVIPRFTNRVASSPYLMRRVLGRMSAADLRRAADASLTAGDRAPHLRLAAGYDFAPRLSAAGPAVPNELSMARVPAEEAAAGTQAYLVQFASPPAPEDRDAIVAAGGVVFAYIPDQAYLVRMSPAARARLAGTGRAAWIGDWQPAYKLSPRVDRLSDAISTYEALLFPDADLPGVSRALTAIGGEVVITSDNGINKLVRFRARGPQLAAVAGLAGIVWIEPRVAPTLDNNNAQWVVQTSINGSRRIWDMGIIGDGQVVMTSDSGINVAHDQFRDPAVSLTTWGDYPTHRKVIAYKMGSINPAVEFGDNSSASYHGTHTACTIVGSDDPVGGTAPYDGMAKDAKIYFMDIGGSTLGTGVDPFADLNDLFLPSYVGNAGGAARITSNSWGAAVGGAYTLNSLEVDQFMWNHPDYYIAFANGNSGTTGSVGSPATAKDCASMGATGNGTSENSIGSFTSRGPCLDGRLKPTFCAPGVSLTSAYGGSTNTYQTLSGTSMATPSGTGAVVLMRQYLTDGWYPTGTQVPGNGFAPSAALLKAMAINSADNGVTGFTAPDNNIGWGRVDADNVLYFAGDARKLLLDDFTAGLGNGQYVDYQVNVVDSLVPLKVSLCWTDFPADPAAAKDLVNNLDLTVSKGATVYKGNVFAAGVSTTGGGYDNTNVEEGVLVNVPTRGVWTVRVAAPSIPMGPQPFGLVITGGVGNGAGALALDRAVYGASGGMDIQVTDTDAIPPVQVTVTSSSEPGGETVTLSGSNGLYAGTLPLSPALPSPGDGVLQVSNGDALVASYLDASTGVTLQARAAVSISTPVITGVHAASLGPVGTRITWTTDLDATSQVYYGTSAALELGSVDSSGYALTHQVLLPNLVPGQTYFYDVQSVGLTGGSARDNRGGEHYRFTAKPTGDVLLLLGDPNFERAVTWENALGDEGYDYDVWSGTLADSAQLGDVNSGLRAYRGVIWQCGPFDYPPVSDPQRATIDSYLGGGGRLWILGHDLGWGLADPGSPSYNTTRAAWVSGTLHANYGSDSPNFTTENGFTGDPISGPYASPNGVSYQSLGVGMVGDDITLNAGTGTAAGVWIDTEPSPAMNALRWESGTPNGTAGTALWGGLPSRLVSMFLEYTAMRPPFSSPDAIRDSILDRTLVWLFNRQRPHVTVIAPNGGENLTGGTTSITWTESVAAGRAVASRVIEYSTDGGDSWSTAASGVGPSPYVWDLSTVPNTLHARVRVRLSDDGSPVLRGVDASDADFTINRAGGDIEGPVVVAGSIALSRNPVVRGQSDTLTATVSDATTGGAGVAAAEWSTGPAAAAAGSGTAMSGAFGATTVAVSAPLDAQTPYFVLGAQQLWVRGRDAAGNWGAAAALPVQVNGTGATGLGGLPVVTFLSQSAPNPVLGGSSTSIQFGLAHGGAVALDVFDAQGRRVRRLEAGTLPPGLHETRWDGRDDSGARLGAGLYFYRLVTRDGRFLKRLVLLP